MPLCMLYEVMVIGRGDMMCNRSVCVVCHCIDSIALQVFGFSKDLMGWRLLEGKTSSERFQTTFEGEMRAKRFIL